MRAAEVALLGVFAVVLAVVVVVVVGPPVVSLPSVGSVLAP